MYLSYISYSNDFSGSSVISTFPRISTYRPVLVSRTNRLIRGSRNMFRTFNLPLMVLNSTVSPSRLTNITDDCGRPSTFDVAIVATCGPSSTARAASLRFTVIAIPFVNESCVYGSGCGRECGSGLPRVTRGDRGLPARRPQLGSRRLAAEYSGVPRDELGKGRRGHPEGPVRAEVDAGFVAAVAPLAEQFVHRVGEIRGDPARKQRVPVVPGIGVD